MSFYIVELPDLPTQSSRGIARAFRFASLFGDDLNLAAVP